MFKTVCSFLIKAQEEQTTSTKGSKQKMKEKTDQVRETQKEKRRMAFNKKGLTGGTSGTITPLSDVEQNNLSGQHSQEKFTRWASEQPRERKAEASTWRVWLPQHQMGTGLSRLWDPVAHHA